MRKVGLWLLSIFMSLVLFFGVGLVYGGQQDNQFVKSLSSLDSIKLTVGGYKSDENITEFYFAEYPHKRFIHTGNSTLLSSYLKIGEMVETAIPKSDRNRRLAKNVEAFLAVAEAWLFMVSVQFLIRKLANPCPAAF